MTRIPEVVHTLRQKPLYVRENIALGVSGGVTLVVALGWLAATAASGTFTLSPTTFAAADSPDVHGAVAASKSNFSQLLGAAGAAIGATTTAPTTIRVVDTRVHSTLDREQVPVEQTVIHF